MTPLDHVEQQTSSITSPGTGPLSPEYLHLIPVQVLLLPLQWPASKIHFGDYLHSPITLSGKAGDLYKYLL